MTSKNTSVVMVSYHTGPVLWLSVESVLRQEGLAELVIVDNGNPVQVVEKLQQLAAKDPRVRVVNGQGNIGFAAACNRGAAAAKGDYLLLLNPDCILPENALTKSIAALEARPKAMLAGCRLVGPDGQEQPGARRNLLTPWVALVESLKLYRLAPNHPYFARMNLVDEALREKPHAIPATSGAFMLMKRETYHAVGGMDEGYFLHVEDLDFCFQIQKAGGDIVFLPDTRVVHFLSTSNTSPFFLEWNKAKGFIRYFYKNFRNTYPPFFLPLMAVGILARFIFKMATCLPRHMLGANDTDFQSLRRLYLLLTAGQARDISGQIGAVQSPVMVTGSTGQVGISIVRQLLRMEREVIALIRRKRVEFAHPKLTWLEGDLEQETLDLKGTTPKTLIHTAQIWLLPRHLPALHAAGVRQVVAFSSTSLFSKASSKNPYEQQLVERFGTAEREIAAACKQLGMTYTILRPTLIYGVGLDRNITSIRRFIERFRVFPIYPPARGKRQPVHVEDLAWAALAVLGNPRTYGKAYNVSGGEVLTYREMVERVFTALGRRPWILSAPFLPWMMDIFSKMAGTSETNGEIARRMNEDLAFDHNQAFLDFSYHPRGFLAGGKRDMGELL